MKRRQYDETGEIEKTVDEEFMDNFGNGNFRDPTRASKENPDLAQQILKRQSNEASSHTSGFEQWMRARGKENMQVFTAEDAAEKFGVVRSSYEGVPLPKIKAYHVS